MARLIWDYHHVNQSPRHADCILCLGSNDTRVASFSGQLFLDAWAPLLIFSGGLGNFTRGSWDAPEAVRFSRIAIEMGVPKENILIEPNSTNSGENIAFTRRLVDSEGLDPSSFILVQKPFMERRALATFKKAWQGKDAIVLSPPISYDEYPNEFISENNLVNTMVGDLQRIKVYPGLGYQEEQEIPVDVWKAYKHLVQQGYTKHLLPGVPAF